MDEQANDPKQRNHTSQTEIRIPRATEDIERKARGHRPSGGQRARRNPATLKGEATDTPEDAESTTHRPMAL